MFDYPQWFLDEVSPKEMDRLSTLKTTDKISFYCTTHGEYIQRIGDHIKVSTMERKGGCPKCRRTKSALRQKPYPQWFLDDLDKSELEDIYSHKSRDKVKFFCREHGVYEQEIHEHINGDDTPKSGCPKCGRKKAAIKRKEMMRQQNPFTQDFMNDLLPEYRTKIGTLNVTDKVPFVCSKHGVYYQRVYDHVNGHGCPDCRPYVYHSSGEDELIDFVKSLGISNIKTNVRGFISDGHRTYEVDILLVDYNIGIEFNGSYWHAMDGGSNKEFLYHQNKFLSAQKKGIHLIQIFDIDWFLKKDKIKQYLESILRKGKTIYARKCSLVEIDKNIANDFYDKYHILGKTIGNELNIALTYENEIVSVMSFRKSKYHGALDWELIRFVTKDNITVVGGASRIFKYFVRKFSPIEVVSYSDNDYFSGDMYSILGFERVLLPTPRYYWYYSLRDVRTRESCQLSRLKDEFPELYNESLDIAGNKEDYIMRKLGYHKVVRSGTTKWIWRIKE